MDGAEPINDTKPNAGTDILNLSQGSASDESPSPTVRRHWLSEKIFDWSGIPTCHLRGSIFYENLFRQFGKGIEESLPSANVRSRVRCRRAKAAGMHAAFAPFARQGHPVGTVSGPVLVGSSKDRASILTEQHDELPPFIRLPRRRGRAASLAQ
jgi:uncharacterized protein YbjT (DUF2867 family)